MDRHHIGVDPSRVQCRARAIQVLRRAADHVADLAIDAAASLHKQKDKGDHDDPGGGVAVEEEMQVGDIDG